MNNLRSTTMKAFKNQFINPRPSAQNHSSEIPHQGSYKIINLLSNSIQFPHQKIKFVAERHQQPSKISLNQSISQVNNYVGHNFKQTSKRSQHQFLNSRNVDDQNQNQVKRFSFKTQKSLKQTSYCKSRPQIQIQPFNLCSQSNLPHCQNCNGINLNNKFISSSMANLGHSMSFSKNPTQKYHQDLSYSEHPIKHDLSCASTQQPKQHSSKINFIQSKRKQLIKDLCNQKQNRGRKTVFNAPAFLKDKTQLNLFQTNKKVQQINLRQTSYSSVPKNFKTYEPICYKRDSGIHKFLLQKEQQKNYERKQCVSTQKQFRRNSPASPKTIKNFFMKSKSKISSKIPRVFEVGKQLNLKIFNLKEGDQRVNLKVLKVLAQNGGSSTYLVLEKSTRFLYCLKKSEFNLSQSSKNTQFPNHLDFLIRQSKIGMSLDHPFLIKTYCTLYDQKNIYQLMQFVEGSTLQNHNRQKKFVCNQSYFKLHSSVHQISHIKQIIQQLLQAVNYLHTKGIVHRDIKPANIFISNNHAFKIGDFGCSIYSPPSDYVGTLDYAAPQIMLHQKHGAPVDMWAIGCIAYELYTGNPPFYHQSRQATIENIIQGKYNLEKIRDEKLKNFIECLLINNPIKRISSKQALQHPFIAYNKVKKQPA